jgi:hypothetical protein
MFRVQAFVSALVLLPLIVSPATARKIKFAPASTFASALSQPAHVVVADFNGDGHLDLAVGNDFNTIAVFLGNGDGTFRRPTLYTDDFYVSGYIAVGDFNGDEKLDLAVVGGDTASNGLVLFTGNGDGTFNPPVYFATTDARSSIFPVAGHFRNHHDLDIFAGGYGGSELLLGDGEGDFQNGQRENVSGFGVSVGDFNGAESSTWPRLTLLALARPKLRCCWETGMALFRFPKFMLV